jgi:hypothetical protein
VSAVDDPTESPVRSYRPGDWFGIVGERAVVILPPTQKARAAALWELVDGGAGFDVTLDALISGGLRDLSAFVLVSTVEGETRVVIRGPARARFRVDGETVDLEGSQATTWVERSLLGVERMTIVLHEDLDADDVPSYVVDGGLFRISRLDEAPAHEGADELAEVPAYEDEFPLGQDAGADDEGYYLDGEPAAEGALPARSPEPPDWIPAPPAVPPIGPPVLPPMPGAPPTELFPEVPGELPAEDAEDADDDGDTRTGAWEPAPAGPPGIPGQPAAPDVTVPVARLIFSSGEVVDVDRAVVVGRAPEARRFSDTEQPLLVAVPSPHLEISSTHLEVRPGSGADHGSAVVTDLGSTNGTVLVQPGLGPEDLASGVPVQLIPGAIIDLGDGVTIQVTGP